MLEIAIQGKIIARRVLGDVSEEGRDGITTRSTRGDCRSPIRVTMFAWPVALLAVDAKGPLLSPGENATGGVGAG